MKERIKSSILSGAFALLLACSAGGDGLKDIAKPYLGVYECTEARLGSTDLLAEFSDIRLELLDEENYQLVYMEKGKERKKVEGKYAYDKEKKSVIFCEKSGYKREFPLQEGKLTVSIPIGNRQALVVFERK